jgi:Tol biopolymer transport system component
LTVRGAFVYAAGDGSLWMQDAVSGDAIPLVERSTESLAQLPAYTPDGKHVAFTALLFLNDGNVRGDIRMVDADGKNVRSLVRAESNDVVYMSPRFAPDGRLLVTRAEQLQTTNEHASLEWVNLKGGAPQRVIDDARDADVSHDGKHIAFVRYEVASGRSSLWLANADGTGARALLDGAVFSAILYPRFSPDDQWLAFGVHGAPQKPLPLAAALPLRSPGTQGEAEGCFFGLLFACLVQRAGAHMAPGALWRVNLSSGKFQPLTDLYDDSPAPAWALNGTQIAIHDFNGIRLVDLAHQEIYSLFPEDGGASGFDWSQ